MRLTFWEGVQLVAVPEAERLERCAVLDTCISQGQYQAHRSPWASGLSGTRKSMHKITFWDGLELLAEVQIERLECCALADGCKKVARSDIPKPLTISVNYSEDQMCN